MFKIQPSLSLSLSLSLLFSPFCLCVYVLKFSVFCLRCNFLTDFPFPHHYARTMQGLIEKYMKSSCGSQDDQAKEAQLLVCYLATSLLDQTSSQFFLYAKL